MLKKYFPYNFLLFYVLFYAGQSIFSGYLSLYLDSIGFTRTQIGMFMSISTLAVLLTQSFWGYVSDRYKSKKTVLLVLLTLCSVFILGFYLGTSMIFVMLAIAMFGIFFNPVPALMDSLTLETLSNLKDKISSKINFGHIRLGGTLGFALGVLAAGQLMRDDFARMFYMMSIMFVLVWLTLKFLIPDMDEAVGDIKKKYSLKVLIQNKRMFCFIFLQMVFSLGMVTFHNFYPLHFAYIGGDSGMVGILMFATAISEIPFWFISGKLINRFGYEKMMGIAVCVSGLRWLVLFLTVNPHLAILVNMSHGFSFVTMNYGIVTYVDKSIPGEMRATGQTMIAMLSTIFSRILGGVFVGMASDMFGIAETLLFAFVFAYVGVGIFFVMIKIGNIKNKTLT